MSLPFPSLVATQLTEGLFLQTSGWICQVPISIFESKDFKDLKLPLGREVLVSVFHTSVAEQQESFLKSFEILQGKYRDRLRRILEQVTSGKKSLRDGNQEAKSLIQDFFLQSYLLGRKSSGSILSKNLVPSKEELDFIKKASETEYGFAQRFLTVSKIGKKFSNHRLEMYVRTLDSLFNSGWLSTFPDDTQIWWILHAKESCPDYIRMAKGSPYTLRGSKPLPFTPRSGSTQCKSNCRCTLRVKLPQKEGEKEVLKSKGLLDEPSVSVDSSDPQIVQSARKLYDELNYVNQQIQLETDPILRKEWIEKRRELNQEIVNFQNTYGVSLVPQFSTRDVKYAAEQVKGMKEIPFSALRAGDKVVVLKNAYSVPVEVSSVSKNKVRVSSPYGNFSFSKGDFLSFYRLSST